MVIPSLFLFASKNRILLCIIRSFFGDPNDR
nr:MAG TPA: hypothetical protein [Caudoviricetes sp.]